jgi:uncharacterized membrane protein
MLALPVFFASLTWLSRFVGGRPTLVDPGAAVTVLGLILLASGVLLDARARAVFLCARQTPACPLGFRELFGAYARSRVARWILPDLMLVFALNYVCALPQYFCVAEWALLWAGRIIFFAAAFGLWRTLYESTRRSLRARLAVCGLVAASVSSCFAAAILMLSVGQRAPVWGLLLGLCGLAAFALCAAGLLRLHHQRSGRQLVLLPLPGPRLDGSFDAMFEAQMLEVAPWMYPKS